MTLFLGTADQDVQALLSRKRKWKLVVWRHETYGDMRHTSSLTLLNSSA